MQAEVLGPCVICKREMIGNKVVDEHHLIPKCKNGRYTDKIKIHRICHNKIHSIWSETELAGYYNTPDRILNNPDMKKFVKWVSKRPPDFYVKTKISNARRR